MLPSLIFKTSSIVRRLDAYVEANIFFGLAFWRSRFVTSILLYYSILLLIQWTDVS